MFIRHAISTLLLRRREAELAADGEPFTPEDLAVLTAFGTERGRQAVSFASQRRVLVLPSTLTLKEIQEAAGPGDVDHLMHMLGWLPANGLAAQRAYTRGYLLGQKSFLPLVRGSASWPRPFVALLPSRTAEQTEAQALAVAAELAESVGRPCSVGAAVAETCALRAAAAPAGRVSRVSPPQTA